MNWAFKEIKFKFVKFAGLGLFVFAWGILFNILQVEVLQISKQTAYTLVVVSQLFLGFFLNRYLVFNGRHKKFMGVFWVIWQYSHFFVRRTGYCILLRFNGFPCRIYWPKLSTTSSSSLQNSYRTGRSLRARTNSLISPASFWSDLEGSRGQGSKDSSELLRNYKDLKVWRKSYGLYLHIYTITKAYPKEEKCGN